MPTDKKVRVAIVGLGFGAEFIPIYQAHPNAEIAAVCRRNKAELDKTADRYKIARRYANYCVSPCLAILSKPGAPAHADKVSCYGSGRIREELVGKYNSPFAVETATFGVRGSDVCAEVTRSLFDTARQYRESFDVMGSKKSFEWQQVDDQEPVIHTKSSAERPIPEPEIPKRTKVPDYAHLL